MLNAHRVFLALHSPFFHDYFQARPGTEINDVYFYNVHSEIVKRGLDLIYKGEVQIDKRYSNQFRWFVETLLKIQLETVLLDIEVNTSSALPQTDVDENAIREPNNPVTVEQNIPSSNTDDTGNVETETNDEFLDDAWTLTTLVTDKLEQILHTVDESVQGRSYKC